MAETINFSEAEKDDLVNVQKLMNILADIAKDEEGSSDVVDGCKKLIDNIWTFRDIICCIRDRERAQELILSLDEDRLVSFECFLSGLQEGRESANYTKAYNALLEMKPSTPRSIQKANILLEKIGKKNPSGLKELSLDIYSLSSHLKALAGIFYNYQNNHQNEEWPSRIGQLSEIDFDRLIPMCESILDFGTISVNDYSGFNKEVSMLRNEIENGVAIDEVIDKLLEVNIVLCQLQKDGDFEKLNEKASLYAPIAFEAYRRLYSEKEVPFFIQDLMYENALKPDDVDFWSNSYAFARLFDKMIDDGYYIPKPKEGEDASA